MSTFTRAVQEISEVRETWAKGWQSMDSKGGPLCTLESRVNVWLIFLCGKCCRMVDSVPRWWLSLSWPIQSVDRRLDITAFGVGTFSWQNPVHFCKAGPGEVMNVEIYHLLWYLQDSHQRAIVGMLVCNNIEEPSTHIGVKLSQHWVCIK